MNSRTLKLLLAGEYICPVRYNPEYMLLEDTSEREEVGTWLLQLGLRLSRVGEEGPFFAANDHIGAKEITQVKNELLRFRDEYGPCILLLDFVRQADAGRVHMSPGEYISLFELEAAVAQSTMLENHLKGLIGVIANVGMRNTNHESLKKLLEHLAKDGYVWLANKDTGTYQVTGKIEQLYAVLQFLDENKAIPDTEVDDREDLQDDLVDAANSGEEATP